MQAVCIEFVNTVEPRVGPVVRDALSDYAGLVRWARRVGLTVPRGLSGEQADRALRAAIELREALFTMLLALADGVPPAGDAVAVWHRHYLAACRSARLDVAPGVVDWRWAPRDPDRIASQVAVDAMAVIGSPAATRLKQCPAGQGGCGWLFVDTTKNGSRRWCSMADCGSTVKARRQAAKRRATRA